MKIILVYLRVCITQYTFSNQWHNAKKKCFVFVQIEKSRWVWPMKLCEVCFCKVLCHLSAVQLKAVSPHQRFQKKDYILAAVLQHFLVENKYHNIKYLNIWNLVWWIATFWSLPMKNAYPLQLYVYEIKLPVGSIYNCNINTWIIDDNFAEDIFLSNAICMPRGTNQMKSCWTVMDLINLISSSFQPISKP